MICLCCGKELNGNEESQWHKACIRRFFNTNSLPEINFDPKGIESLVLKNEFQGFTVPGVQKKMSLHLSIEKKQNRLTLIDYPTGYILKPQVEEYESLPELEWISMRMAESIGIQTVPHALLSIDHEYSYISKRIDRIIDKKEIKKLAMEDFCQLDLRQTADKYRGSYERCAKIIKKYSCRPGIDLSEFFMRVFFSYMIGNSDMHLKNLSMIETNPGSHQYVLSKAYDLLPVQVVLPEDEEEFALTLNEKKKNITKKDFYAFGQNCGMDMNSCKKMMEFVVSKKDEFIRIVNESFLNDDLKSRFIHLVSLRMSLFEK